MMPVWLVGAMDGDETRVLSTNTPLTLALGSQLLALPQTGSMQHAETAMVDTWRLCGVAADGARGLGEGSTSSML